MVSALYPVLLVTDSATDSALVSGLLEDAFSGISVGSDAARIAASFAQRTPCVLLLAFRDVERAKRYYRGLGPAYPARRTFPHRTVFLCNNDDAGRAFALCRTGFFDDYVPFWPLAHDARRLPMSVLLALRGLASERAAAPRGFVAEDAGLIAERKRPTDSSFGVDITGNEIVATAQPAVEPAARDPIDDDGDESDVFSMDDVFNAFEPGGAQAEPPHREDGAERVPLQSPSLDRVRVPAVQAESSRTAGVAAGPQRPRVLIVDDDMFQCKLLGTLLESDRYELAFAHSAAETFQALRVQRPDLILMDVVLPDLDGVEITRRLKVQLQYAAIPVVMITGHSDRQVLAESLRAGAVDFVVKPFDRKILCSKVAKYLRV